MLCLAFAMSTNHTGIKGTVTDASTGEPTVFATVSLYLKGILIKGTETDMHGAYEFSGINPGTYDVEVSYVGFTTQSRKEVVVNAGKITEVDFKLESGAMLEEVEIVEYSIPLYAQDISHAHIKTAEQIRNIPTKDIRALSGTASGTAKDEAISIRGIRTDATQYYIDGVSVSGNAMPGSLNNVEDLSHEAYSMICDNAFLRATDEPLSTFSIDVDRAAYSNMRRYLQSGQKPPVDAIRIEEMINYFDYDYPQPEDKPFSITTEMHPCPWAPDHQLLHIGLQGKQMETASVPASNLVFLVDVSGSMQDENKLPLVIRSLQLLVDQLREQDRIAIAVYAGAAGLVLPGTSGARKGEIKDALERLRAGGSTAGAAGIELAYETARANFIKQGNNRVILATDGDFNVGVSNNSDLVRMIEQERESGIFLTVLGFGMGNYKDDRMQQLADHGNGNHSYIDNINEARKIFVHEFSGTLFTIAKDVKIQVEFNPAKVQSYRLIGYENRLLAAQDFNDDQKDAGEIGAGHTVTALYEIIPVGVQDPFSKPIDHLKYQHVTDQNTNTLTDEWLTIKFRYKAPDGVKSKLIEQALTSAQLSSSMHRILEQQRGSL
jgi:Ca-activated chloride channel family protein